MVDEKDLRRGFKDYLNDKVSNGKLSVIDANTQYSDADYPRKHAQELGLDYFEMFKTDKDFEQALDLIKLNFEKNGKKNTTFLAYKRALLSFRDFYLEYLKNHTKKLSVKAWFIRSNNGEFVQDFLEKQVVGIGWLRESYEGKSREAIKNCILKECPNEKQGTIDQWAGCCWRFACEIKVNDYVITNNNDGTLHIGKIIGEYEYSPDFYKENPHIRSVKWIEKIERKTLPAKIQSYLKSSLTVTSFDDSEAIKCLEEICKQNSNKEQDMTKIPLNQILYGPPGTGKTYNTVIKAMEIIGIKEVFYNWYCKNSNAMNKDKTFKDYDAAIEVIKQSFNINLYSIIDKDEFGAIKSNIVNSIEFQKELKHAKTSQGTSYYESALNQYGKFLCSVKYVDFKEYFNKLKQQGQIEFVTFHQSYSYEEFVEGIKPDLENGKELRYKLQNGIFKTICNNAKELLETKVKHNFNKNNISVYKILIPDESLFAYCIENDCVAINWGNDIDISNCDSQEEIIAKIPEDFESRKQCISQLNLFKLWIDNDLKSGKDVIVVIPGSMNTIKGIAKITGDYFYNSDIENGHQQRKVDWIRKNINISSDNIYNSKFVSPTITGMFNDKINWDTFLNLINNKNNSKSSNAVLVIDEINRGDVSKIFGELITLIEEDKRIGKEHQMTVTLPYSREPFGVPNNLYIIGTMNTADRSIALLDTALRRRFDFEEMMPKPELLRGKDIEGVDLELLLTKINDRIKNEYDRDHQIGHSYLMEVENKEQLERAYKNRILPLLNEYFYNDIDSVAKILNCKPNDISSKENWFNVLKEAQKPTKKDNEQ